MRTMDNDDLFGFDNIQPAPDNAQNPQTVPDNAQISQPAPNNQQSAQVALNYEQISYGKYGYKRIQRLRRKGRRRGLEIPTLNYELTRPEKPRVVFLIAAIITLIIFLGLMVGAGFLIKFGVDFFSVQFKDSGGFFKTLLNPQAVIASLGLSIVPVLLIVLAYIMMILILLIPIFLVLYCYRLIRNAFYMAQCSKEEFAKSEFVGKHISAFAIILVIATVLLIVVLIRGEAPALKLVVGLVYLGVVIIFGGMLALMIVERRKCKTWFDSLDEGKKQNYLAHEEGIRRVKKRLQRERNYLTRF